MFGFIRKFLNKFFDRSSTPTKTEELRSNNTSIVTQPPPPKHFIKDFDIIFKELEAETNDLIARYS